MTDLTEDELDVLDRVRKLDEISRLIFMTGVRALASSRFTIEEFHDWVSSRLARHRAGEDLTLADIMIDGVVA
ncbi:hypothetical protein [Paracoccus pantotrophus]|uniref:hypothetical protein n=1 Tax=Paracoccus pantotrophus TaxID=82367 RepID=UPI0035AFE67D